MRENNPTFSVILNTTDRAGPLRTLLRALEHQSYPDFEVLVVVGPTQDNTLEMLSEYRDRIRLFSQPYTQFESSRNIGLLGARGDVVAFVDDDAVPCQRWLEQYARIFREQLVDATGGAVWAAHPKFAMLQFRLGIYSSLAEQQDVRSSWLDDIIPRGMASRWMPRLPGGNLAIRRTVALEAGGFDEFFAFVAEEADFALRLADIGKIICPLREAPIYHFPASGPNRQAFTNKGRWWMRTRSRVYLSIKHGLASGEILSKVLMRTARTAVAHFPWYLRLVRDREISLIELFRLAWHEISSFCSAAWHGLFSEPQLIASEAIEKSIHTNEPILKYQNGMSMKLPSTDPVSGYQPSISLSEPPLRICLLSNTYPPEQYGGIARLTHLMAQGLFDLGHTVHVITRSDREVTTFYDGAYVHKIPNKMEHYSHLRNYYNLYATLNYSHNVYEKVQRLQMNDGIQVVDSPFWQYEGLVTLKSGLLPVVVRLVTGIRQVNAIHGTRVDDFRLMGDLEQAFLEQANYLLPNTDATLNAMRKVYDFGTAESRYSVVPYGIIPAPEEQVRPFDLNAPHETMTVLFVGRLEKRKGILDLFEAIPQVLKHFPNARFVLAGSDNSQNDGFKLHHGMNYPEFFASRHAECLPSVEFMGAVSDEMLQTLYQSCDLFVAPSLYESFGLIYLEAMNFAKPVIGCQAGGIPEVVNHGVSGVLIEPEAPMALAETIVSLLQSPTQLRDLGLAGRQQILDRFNYLQMARNYADVYRKVIAEFNASRQPSGE